MIIDLSIDLHEGKKSLKIELLRDDANPKVDSNGARPEEAILRKSAVPRVELLRNGAAPKVELLRNGARPGVELGGTPASVSVDLIDAIIGYLEASPDVIWVSEDIIQQLFIESNLEWIIN